MKIYEHFLNTLPKEEVIKRLYNKEANNIKHIKLFVPCTETGVDIIDLVDNTEVPKGLFSPCNGSHNSGGRLQVTYRDATTQTVHVLVDKDKLSELKQPN